ncbi:MAG: hypothetical protein WDW36_006218 [Sanguina aurantia]
MGFLGRSITHRPRWFIFVPLVVALLCSVGWKTFRIENDSETLWTPSTSQSKTDQAWVDDNYSSTGGGGATFLATVKTDHAAAFGSNALQLQTTWEMFRMDALIRAINITSGGKVYVWTDMCNRNKLGACSYSGYLNFWSQNFDTYLASMNGSVTDPTAGNLSALISVVNSAKFPDGSTAAPLAFLGGVSVANNGFSAAQVVSHVYVLYGGIPAEVSSKWYTAFLALLKTSAASGTYTAFSYIASPSVGLEISRTIKTDVKLIAIAIVLFLLMGVLFLSRYNRVTTRTTLALMGILAACLGLLAGYGLAMAWGCPFTTLSEILPFVLIGVGLDTMLILTKAYDEVAGLHPGMPLASRMRAVMSGAGLSVAVTLLASTVAFALGATSALNSVKWFSVFACLSMLCIAFMEVGVSPPGEGNRGGQGGGGSLPGKGWVGGAPHEKMGGRQGGGGPPGEGNRGGRGGGPSGKERGGGSLRERWGEARGGGGALLGKEIEGGKGGGPSGKERGGGGPSGKDGGGGKGGGGGALPGKEIEGGGGGGSLRERWVGGAPQGKMGGRGVPQGKMGVGGPSGKDGWAGLLRERWGEGLLRERWGGLTLFMGYFVITERRIRNNRFDCLCCIPRSGPPPDLAAPADLDPDQPPQASSLTATPPTIPEMTHRGSVVNMTHPGPSAKMTHQGSKPAGFKDALAPVADARELESASLAPHVLGPTPTEKSDHIMKVLFKKYYTPTLMRLPVKLIVLALFLAYILYSGFAATSLKLGQPLSDIAPDDSYIQPFEAVQAATFNQQTGASARLYFRSIDVSDPGVQYKMLTATAAVLGTPYVNSTLSAFQSNWLISFISWVQSTHPAVALTASPQCFNPYLRSGVISGSLAGLLSPQILAGCIPQANFYPLLNQYLSTHPSMKSNFQYETDSSGNITSVSTSYVGITHTADMGYDRYNIFMIEAVASVTSYVNSNIFGTENAASPPLPVFMMYTSNYVYASADALLGPITMEYILLALLGIFIVMVVMVADLGTALLMVVSVGMVDLFLFGEMKFLDIRFNQVSVVNMIMATGLAVDYSIYFAQRFMHEVADGTRNGRVVAALNETGSAVFLGGICALVGVVPIAFSSSIILRTFFKLIFGTILFSLLVGLTLMPVVFSFIGPPPLQSATASLPTKSCSGDLEASSTPSKGMTVKGSTVVTVHTV